MKEPKPVTAYAVVTRWGAIHFFTINYRRKDAIREYMKGLTTGESWAVYRKKYGLRCIRITITPEPTETQP